MQESVVLCGIESVPVVGEVVGLAGDLITVRNAAGELIYTGKVSSETRDEQYYMALGLTTGVPGSCWRVWLSPETTQPATHEHYIAQVQPVPVPDNLAFNRPVSPPSNNTPPSNGTTSPPVGLGTAS